MDSQKKSKKKILIPLVLLLVIGGAYLLMTQRTAVINEENARLAEGVIILDGNIHQLAESGNEQKLLYSITDFESDFITKFTEVNISPDSAYFCFLGETPISAPVLYFSPITGAGATKIAVGASNCVWSPNGRLIAYNNTSKNDKPIHVNVYDLRNGKTTVLTDNAAQVGTMRNYKTPEWTESSNRIIAEFEEIGLADKVLRREGVSQIDVTEKRIVDK